MKLIVGWWCRDSGLLVSIPMFDHVTNSERWLPVMIEVSEKELTNLLVDMQRKHD